MPYQRRRPDHTRAKRKKYKKTTNDLVKEILHRKQRLCSIFCSTSDTCRVTVKPYEYKPNEKYKLHRMLLKLRSNLKQKINFQGKQLSSHLL
jgi:hypothetical protein